MSRWTVERLAAATGILFVALLLASLFVTGEQPPNLQATNAEILTFFGENHRALLISVILGGLALVAFLWFLGSVAATLRRGGEPRLATVAFGAGVATASLAGASLVIQATIAFRLSADAPQIAKALYDMQFLTQTIVGFPAAAFVAAVSIAAWRSRLLPQWFGLVGLIGAAIVLVGAGAFKQKGFYAPDGAYRTIALIVFLAWTLALSGILATRTPAEEAEATVGAPVS
jgi:Domain of unknown function (DUF4386)